MQSIKDPASVHYVSAQHRSRSEGKIRPIPDDSDHSSDNLSHIRIYFNEDFFSVHILCLLFSIQITMYAIASRFVLRVVLACFILVILVRFIFRLVSPAGLCTGEDQGKGVCKTGFV